MQEKPAYYSPHILSMSDSQSSSSDNDSSTPAGAKSFNELLDSKIPSQKALLEKLESLSFTTPTAVQSSVIPAALDGQDLVAQAQTGSGKTLAFVIPMLAILGEQKSEDNNTRALVVTPTRELALQIKNVVADLSDDVEPVLVIGGADEDKQKKALAKDGRVVVGTPGRLLDLIQKKVLKLKHCGYFVLDEADEMLSMGFIDDIRAILARLPKKRQGLFVSATITPRVDMIANSFLTKSEQITVDSYKSDTPAIEHLYIEVGSSIMDKPNALCDIIETQRPQSAIIFCNTKSDTQLVEVVLRRKGFDARRLNSDLSQSQRNKVIQKIRDRELQLLVATDIAARGLDIEQIDLVVNYTIHDQAETYVHRTGRTGRAGRAGRAISLIGPQDFGAFHFLKKVLSFELNQAKLPSDEEVADARLSHLYEILRSQEASGDKRSKILASKLLRDNGVNEDISDDLSDTVIRLSEFAIEHFVQKEAQSLDEELAQSRDDSDRDDRGRRNKDRDRKKDKGRDRSRRGDSPGDSRDDNRSDSRRDEQNEDKEQSRDRDSRQSSRRDERKGKDSDSAGSRSGQSDKESSSDEESSSDKDNRKDNRKENRRSRSDRSEREEESKDPKDKLRLYISSGKKDGLDSENFLDLIKEHSDLNEENVQRSIFRDSYGYVDVTREDAENLMKSLAEVEVDGKSLEMQIATSFPFQRRNSRGGDRRGNSGRSGGGRSGGGRGGRGNSRRSSGRRDDNREDENRGNR